jgi:endothelin-converting enzyme/putative endopeptidase
MEPIGGIGFGVGVGADDKIAVKPLSVGVGRLGLLIRIIILHKKKRYEKKRDKYEQHIARMLQFIGETQCKPKQVQLRYLWKLRCLIHVWIE